jgi:hypothetical protein
VTVAIQTEDNAPNGRVRGGSIADDEMLTRQLRDLTFEGLTETLSPDDLIPFVDLGRFSPLQAKFLDLIFTYNWGDDRPCCALRTAMGTFTIAPVPEPSALTLLEIGLIVLAGIWLATCARVTEITLIADGVGNSERLLPPG